MLSSTVLIFNLLFAFVVTADNPPASIESLPPSHVEQRTTAHIQSRVTDSKSWAGAVWDEPNGTFDSVAGTLLVPHPKLDNKKGNIAMFSVLIDGLSASCAAYLMATIALEFTDDGGPVYNAWAVFSNNFTYFTNLAISPGDLVRLNVTITTPTSGIATIENFTNDRRMSIPVNSTGAALCGSSAAWTVEDPGSPQSPYAMFEDVTFTDALATGPHTCYNPSGADIYNLMHNNQILTYVSINESSVTIHRL